MSGTSGSGTIARVEAIQRLVNEADPADKVIVDIGAGNYSIVREIPSKQNISLDIRLEARPDIVCNLRDSIPVRSGGADIVVAGEIIEHIAESRKFLREIRRILSPNGELILSTPNILSAKHRFIYWFLLGKIPPPAARGDYTYAEGDQYHNWGHVRDYSFPELRQVLTDNGFKLIKEVSIGMHWRSVRLVPPWLMPTTFSDFIIVRARRV